MKKPGLVFIVFFILVLSCPFRVWASSKIHLNSFQIWADPYSFRNSDFFGVRKCFPAPLSTCHLWHFSNLNQRVWDLERIKVWIDRAADLGIFNAFSLGDDAPTFQYQHGFDLGDREVCSLEGDFDMSCWDEFDYHPDCSAPGDIQVALSHLLEGTVDMPDAVCAGRDFVVQFDVPSDLAPGSYILQTGWVTSDPDSVSVLLDGNIVEEFDTESGSGGLSVARVELEDGEHELVYRVTSGDGFGFDFISLGAPAGNPFRYQGFNLFTKEGIREDLGDTVVQPAFSYAHEKGLLTMVEPWVFPDTETPAQLVGWVDSLLEVPENEQPDFIVIGLDPLSNQYFSGECYLIRGELVPKIVSLVRAVKSASPQQGIIIDLTNPLRCFPDKDYVSFVESIKSELTASEQNGLFYSFYGLDIRNLNWDDELDGLFEAVDRNHLLVQLNPTEDDTVGGCAEDGHYRTNPERTQSTLTDKVFPEDIRNLNVAGLNWGWEQDDVESIAEALQPQLELADSREHLYCFIGDHHLPYDLSGDCYLGNDDLREQLSRYGTGDGEADLNGDGLVNGLDFGEMVNLLQASN